MVRISKQESLEYQREYNRTPEAMKKSRERAKAFRQSKKGKEYNRNYQKKYYQLHREEITLNKRIRYHKNKEANK